MPKITSLEDPGYKIIPPKQKEFNFEMINITPNTNHQVIPDPKMSLVKPDQNSSDYFMYIPERINWRLPQLFIDEKMPTVVPDMNQRFVDSFELASIVPDMHDYNFESFKLATVVPDMNSQSLTHTDMAMVVPDMNSRSLMHIDMAMVVPNTNFQELPDFSIVPVVKDMNLNKPFSVDMAMVVPNTNFQEIPEIEMAKVVANKNRFSGYSIPMAMVKSNENRGLDYVVELAKLEPNKNTQDLIKAGVAPIAPNFETGVPAIDFNGSVVDNKNSLYKGEPQPNPAMQVSPADDGFAGGIANIGESIKSVVGAIGDMLNPVKWAEKAQDYAKAKWEQAGRAFNTEAKKMIANVEYAMTARTKGFIDGIRRDPLKALQKMPESLEDLFNGVVKDAYNLVGGYWDKIASKVNDVGKIVSKFTGVEVPVMKDWPSFPSPQDMLAKAKAAITKKKAEELSNIQMKNKAMVGSANMAGQEGETDRDLIPKDNPFYKASKYTKYGTYNENDNVPLIYKHRIDFFEVQAEMPEILDNIGNPTLDNRVSGKGYYIYGGFRESPWVSVNEGIFRGHVGFEGVPDIWCDIKIEPHMYEVDGKVFGPPAYPSDALGGFMLTNFEARDIQMNTEEAWNLGPFGTIPLGASMVLPSSLSLSFAADGYLHTHRWIMAVMEYMFGSRFSVHAMRPYKMCCYEITLYATTFYGETVYARTYLAYPLFNFAFNMLGTGTIKVFDTDWVVVGMLEYDISPKKIESTKPDILDGGILLENSYSYDLDKNSEQEGSLKSTAGDYMKKLSNDKDLIGKAQKWIEKNPQFKKLADKLGLSKLFLQKGAMHLITAFCDIGVNLPKNSPTTPDWFQPQTERAEYNDKLCIDRANAQVKELVEGQGVDPKNIKVILGSADGIPGYDFYVNSKESGKAFQNGTYFIGGIFKYNPEDATGAGGNQSQAPTFKNNRHGDFICFDTVSRDCPQFLEYLIGDVPPAGDDDEVKRVWNDRIEKVQFGRWYHQGGYNTVPEYKDAVYYGPVYSNVESMKGKDTGGVFDGIKGGDDAITPPEPASIDPAPRMRMTRRARRAIPEPLPVNKDWDNPDKIKKLTKEEKVKQAEQAMYMLDQELVANGADEELVKDYQKQFNIIEKNKKNTEYITRETALYDTYELEVITSHDAVYNRSLAWWKTTFGSNKYNIDNKIPNTQEEIENEAWTLSFPFNAEQKDKEKIPCIKINIMSEEFIKEDNKLQYLLNTYFLNRDLCWIYNIYKDNLTLYQKKWIK